MNGLEGTVKNWSDKHLDFLVADPAIETMFLFMIAENV